MPAIVPFPQTRKKVSRTFLVRAIHEGKLFIYPTDTIYGIGCNALDEKSVRKIKSLKKRDQRKPLSVIAPSKKWICQHCVVQHSAFLKKLPGPYTFIFKKKKKNFLRETSSTSKIGIRIPRHPFARFVKSAGVPFITTSVNVSGKKPIRQIREIPKSILKKVDFVLDDGLLENPPSKIVDLSGEKPIEVKRK